MGRGAQLILAGWFAVSTVIAQSCMTPPANTLPPVSQRSSTVGTASYGATSSADPTDPVDTTGYSPDEAESRALTDYLTQHRLPLVGAQVLNGPEGKRAVVLYGFVGSEFGRNDAAEKTRRFTGDTAMAVDNRIKVRPEILASKTNPGLGSAPPADMSGSPDGSSPDSSSPDNTSPDAAYPGVNSYVQQQNNAASQYPGQPPTTTMGSMVPLIMMLGILSMSVASGGSGFSVGPGMTGSPYSGSPYSPYAGYPSAPPYGSSPYGGSSFGPSPFNSAPTSPYYP
jgi:hypothetical protein